MSVNTTLYGTVYAIPETDERNWGSTMTNFSTNSGNGLDGISLLLGTGKTLLKSEITTATIADAATLTPLTTVHRISGTGAAATLDGTTAIADGSVDGQWLCLIGNDNTNTVTIDTGANTTLNGQVVLTLGDVIFLIWDATASVWQEVARNN
jgi:hypothetical protein